MRRQRSTQGSVLRGIAGGLLASAILLLLLPAAFVHAQDDPVDPPVETTLVDPVAEGLVSPDQVAAVAKGLNCPLCQGYNLQDCPLPVCQQMRAEIARHIAAGESEEQIVQRFIDDYGPQVLNAPPTEGLYLGVWLAPGILLGIAAIGLIVMLRKRAAAQPADLARLGRVDPVSADPGDAAYAQCLERMLQDRDE